jgi:Leucine-rich repeat (LRR) protein
MFVNLRVLYIHNNQLTTMKYIKNLINLEMVYLQNNQIKSVLPMYNCKNAYQASYCNNPLVPFNKLNLIKYVDNNKFNNYNYWQHHFIPMNILLKMYIFNNLKKILIADFKHILRKSRHCTQIYPQI